MKYLTISIILFCLLFSKNIFGQTIINTDVTANTTWDVAGSPFLVQQDVMVDSGIVLTISPGVIIKFSLKKSLGIDGTIRAVADSLNPISFEDDTIGNPIDFYWSGIYLTGKAEPFDKSTQGGSFFKYCTFSYSGQPNPHVGNTAFTVASQVSLGFDHCTVTKCACGLIGVAGSQVSNNLFNQCTADAYSGYLIKLGQNSVVFNNLIFRTAVGNGLGLMAATKNIAIHNNLFIRNNFVFCQALDITDSCKFYGNTFVEDTASLNGVFLNISGGSINQNLFANNKGGYQTFTLANCSPDFHNNNVVKNETELGTETEMIAAAAGGQANAENNFWGYNDSASIATVIYDFADNASLCSIDFVPFQISPDTSAPVIPPTHVIKRDSINNLLHVWWNKNSESDLHGYKVYYGGFTGYSFTNVFDAGTDTSAALPGVAITEPVGVTAYDLLANGFLDQYEGHESWYTLATPDTVVGIHTIASVNNKILVDPNPSSGNFVIQLPAGSFSVSLSVFDVEGRKILETNTRSSTLAEIHLDRPGIYFLQATSTQGNIGSQKIIVAR